MLIREAQVRDVPALFEVRTLVDENHMTREELSARGITEESVQRDLMSHLRGWVAEDDGRVVGFSLADRSSGQVWALFILPAFHGRGLGGVLLRRASEWLFTEGFEKISLSTDPATRAYGFYRHHGWHDAGDIGPKDRRLTLERPGS